MAIDPNIKKKADDIRYSKKGSEVRESLASGLESMSEEVVDNTGRQDFVEEQFQQVIENTTDKDVISAPEIIAARNGKNNLKQRLDSEHQQVTAQLAQTHGRMDGVAINPMFPPVPFAQAKADANYYDEATQKYYKDEAMTVPATDNQGVIQGLVDYLHDRGGGTVLLPVGNFAIHSAINWRSKVSLVGANKIASVLLPEGELFSAIRGIRGAGNGSDANNPDVWLEDCTFQNFAVDNKGLTYKDPHIDGKALFIIYMKRAVFRDLVLLNTIGTALGCDFLVDSVIDTVFTYRAGRNATGDFVGGNSGIGIGTTALSKEPLVVTNCFTYQSGNYGIFVETQHNPNAEKAKYAKIVNCHSEGNRLGFGNKGSGGTQFIGCTAISNQIHGFHLTQESYGDQLLGCISVSNGGDGIRIEKDYRGELEISNSRANNNAGAGIRALLNEIGLENVRLSQVQAHKNGTSGVWFGGNTKNLKLIDIDAVNNGQDTSVDALLRRGILIQGTNDVLSVLDSTVFDDQENQTQWVGIDISSGTRNFLLDGNNVTTYPKERAYRILSENGTFGANRGLVREASGQARFADGVKAMYVDHYLGKTTNKLSITPLKGEQVWVTANEPNRFRIERTSTTGAMDVLWEARL